MRLPIDLPCARSSSLFALLTIGLAASPPLGAQGSGDYTDDRLLEVAGEVIDAAGYATLATVDEDGRPRLRVMDPLPPGPGMVIWFATNPATRKVREIRANREVTVFYFDPGSLAYVTISGTARLVDDADEKAEHWKDAWARFYPNQSDAVLLIEVTPRWMEVVSVTHGVTGPDETWLPPIVEFGGN